MKKQQLLWLLPATITIFAFVNSALPGEQSTNLSFGFLKYFQSFLEAVNIEIPTDTLHLLIRKAAHFTEYAALGFSMILADYYQKRTLFNYKIIIPLLIIIPVIDEFIQYFTLNRSCQFGDMLIDWSGIIFGIFVFYLFYRLSEKR